MPELVTQYSEFLELKLALALQLSDRFTRQPQLVGETTVQVAGHRATPFQKLPGATFLFFELAPGAYTIEVRSSKDTPYYRAVNIPVLVPSPDPLWPAYPDISVADKTKPLDDPTQSAAYRAQRALAALQPTAKYPFPEGASLVRGTVYAGQVPLAGARVRRVGDDLEYVTATEGEFVLFFDRVKGTGQKNVTLRASHPFRPDVDVMVDLRRGMTVAKSIVMAP